MTKLQLIMAPDPIFKQKSLEIDKVTAEIRDIMDQMLDILDKEQGIGMSASMTGVLKRIVVIKTENKTYFMANPKIISASKETQTHNEASLCFPGISADITRANAIELEYLDYDGNPQKLKEEGFMATVIQHEIDYLDGKIFLDYLSPLKKKMLLKKMGKYHKHGHSCSSACEH